MSKSKRRKPAQMPPVRFENPARFDGWEHVYSLRRTFACLSSCGVFSEPVALLHCQRTSHACRLVPERERSLVEVAA